MRAVGRGGALERCPAGISFLLSLLGLVAAAQPAMAARGAACQEASLLAGESAPLAGDAPDLLRIAVRKGGIHAWTDGEHLIEARHVQYA